MRNPTICKTPLLFLTAIAIFAPSRSQADININFNSIFEANNTQSDGSPMDAGLTFEFGSFTGDFSPAPANTSEWMSHWVATPNSNNNPISGPTVEYSTDNVPFGGPANAFQGFVTLATNETPFTDSNYAYFWGYTERDLTGISEWVLLANPSWMFPPVVPGEIETSDENWRMSDSGTFAVVGGVNPAYNPLVSAGAQEPHMSSAAIFVGAPVPEPSTGAMMLLSLVLVGSRRRTT